MRDDHLALLVHAALLGLGDQLLGVGPQRLGLGHRGGDRLGLEEGAARLAIICAGGAGSPPKRGPFFGRGIR